MARRPEHKHTSLLHFLYLLFLIYMWSFYYGAHKISFRSQTRVLVAVLPRSSSFYPGSMQVLRHFSHNVTVADKCMRGIIVFCTHLTAHTAGDTSISQPAEGEGCIPSRSRFKVTVAVKSFTIPHCHFKTRYGGKLLHVQGRARLSGLDGCSLPQQPGTQTECRMSIGRLHLISVNSQLLC